MNIRNYLKKAAYLTVALLFSFTIGHAQRIQPDVLPLKKGTLQIQPLVHASLVLTADKTVIYADPTGGADNYKGLAAPDIIVVTDIHGDHFDPKTLDAVSTATSVLVVPQAVADKLTPDEKKNAVILKNGEEKTIKGILIHAIPMYNLPESPDSKHLKGRGNGYVITVGGKSIYLSGDTQGIPEMKALTHIDVAFVCMNLPYTMDVNEAAAAVLAFKPAIVYPYHYRGMNGLSDVNSFKSQVEAGDKNIEVRLRNWYPGH